MQYNSDEFRIETYDKITDSEWDDFVENKSANGTFLQTRRFIDYHSPEKFKECSLVFFNHKNNIIALCPANEIEEDEKKIFFSYQGATFGGLIIASKYYKAKYLLRIVKELIVYLRVLGYTEMYLKNTPEIFSKQGSALLEYICYYNGFTEYKELNPFIDYSKYKSDVLSNLSQGKRSHVHKCEREGVVVRQIDTDFEISRYYEILCENLSKYNLLPVHTLSELLDFKNYRLKNECEFFGLFLNNEMIAGGMLFYFEKTKTAHTQYLSAKSDFLQLSPMTYLYYWLIKEMKERGYKKLSWGICTENHGTVINEGLINSKEDFGSTYTTYNTYVISLNRRIK